ncbi:MAG TPA: hypothetical protein VE734_00665, partial [Terriglobales bacterium]|nr:hypothetical protein [Terriglobales bacterium]
DTHNYFVNATDATYEGFYTYLPDTISPSCGTVTMEVYSEKNPENAVSKLLDEKTVATVWQDFEPYRAAVASLPTGDPPTTAASPENASGVNTHQHDAETKPK